MGCDSGRLRDLGASWLGWVLRRRRQAWQRRSGGSTSDFVARLRDHGIAADASRVSRWELGRARAGGDVLLAYEAICEVPALSLLALELHLRRSGGLEPDSGGTDLRSCLGTASMHESLDRLAEGGEVSAADQLRGVSGLFDAQGQASFVSRALAGRLVNTLLDQLSVSVGGAQIVRFEAVSRALDHPRLGPLLLARVREHIEDPLTGAFPEILELLTERGVLHERHLHQLLNNPNDVVVEPAIWAAVHWLRVAGRDTAATARMRQAVAEANHPDLGLVLPSDLHASDGLQQARQARLREVARPLRSLLMRRQWFPGGATSTEEETLSQLVSCALLTEDRLLEVTAGLVLRLGGVPAGFAATALDAVNDTTYRLEARLRISQVLEVHQGDLSAAAVEAAALASPAPITRRLLAVRSQLPEPVTDAELIEATLRDPLLSRSMLRVLGMTRSPVLSRIAGSQACAPINARAAWWERHGGALAA